MFAWGGCCTPRRQFGARFLLCNVFSFAGAPGMGGLKLETRTAALGREATDSLLNKSEPHQRGFGTAERFQSDPGGMGPGPYTSGAELQLVTGFNPMVVCKATKAQSFSVTCKRFLTNEAIIASKQNLPDADNPAPNRHASRVSLRAWRQP